MKYIILLTILGLELFAVMTKSSVLSVDLETNKITTEMDKVDVGVSGFVVKTIDDEHTVILKKAEVIAYNKESGTATLIMSDFTVLQNSALPAGTWKVSVGDSVELAFAYDRALLIAPSEEIYHRITKSVKVQWVHSDIFATQLSGNGHPTPLKEDFEEFGDTLGVGLLFIYLDKKLFTVDINSFKILNVSEAALEQKSVKLPFYSRLEKISANWFGAGSSELETYEPYYYELLKKSNPQNGDLK